MSGSVFDVAEARSFVRKSAFGTFDVVTVTFDCDALYSLTIASKVSALAPSQ